MEININEVSMENQTNDYTNLLEATEVDYAMIELRYNQWMCIEDYLFHKAAKAEGKVLLEDVTVNPRNEADKEASKKNVPKGQAFMAKIKEMIQTFVNFMKSVIYKFMDKVQELLKLNTGLKRMLTKLMAFLLISGMIVILIAIRIFTVQKIILIFLQRISSLTVLNSKATKIVL